MGIHSSGTGIDEAARHKFHSIGMRIGEGLGTMAWRGCVVDTLVAVSVGVGRGWCTYTGLRLGAAYSHDM